LNICDVVVLELEFVCYYNTNRTEHIQTIVTRR
jgi:hypothetical protein